MFFINLLLIILKDVQHFFQNFSSQLDDPINLIWQKIENNLNADPTILSSNQSVHLRKVSEGNYAFLNDLTGLQEAQRHDCHLSIMREKLSVFNYAFALAEGSVYTPYITHK